MIYSALRKHSPHYIIICCFFSHSSDKIASTSSTEIAFWLVREQVVCSCLTFKSPDLPSLHWSSCELHSSGLIPEQADPSSYLGVEQCLNHTGYPLGCLRVWCLALSSSQYTQNHLLFMHLDILTMVTVHFCQPRRHLGMEEKHHLQLNLFIMASISARKLRVAFDNHYILSNHITKITQSSKFTL